MKINVQALEFPCHEELDCPPLDERCPLVILARAVVEHIRLHPEVQEVASLVSPESYPEVDFPCTREGFRADIDILLASSREVLNEWTSGDEVLGVFLATAGVLEPDAFFSRRLQVLVPCDVERLRAHIEEERSWCMPDRFEQSDRLALEAFLTTLTHELAHAVDFARHAGGLSPHDVDVLFDAGLIDFDVGDACTGLVVRPEMDHLFGEPEAASLHMEERVEDQGRRWLTWALNKVPQSMIDACLAAAAPVDESCQSMRLRQAA